MVFMDRVPSFDGSVLSTTVGGMHYFPDGSVVRGTYDLVMRDSVARCLYGFNNAPISATVSITNDTSGNQNVATTNVSDNSGWLHVSAAGFTFSDPTVQVKLIQAGPNVAKYKKWTITCVSFKNKRAIRRVTSIRPSCPVGYKKK
jgi:hypothetical protein